MALGQGLAEDIGVDRGHMPRPYRPSRRPGWPKDRQHSHRNLCFKLQLTFLQTIKLKLCLRNLLLNMLLMCFIYLQDYRIDEIECLPIQTTIN